jgi:hypothetical protein
VRQAYLKLEPRLRNAFNESQSQAPRTPPPLPHPERDKLRKGAADDTAACLKVVFVDVVPFSDENADTLAKALIARCDHRYQRLASVLRAFPSNTPADAEYQARQEADFRELLAEIVTFRWKRKQRDLSTPSQQGPGTPARSY